MSRRVAAIAGVISFAICVVFTLPERGIAGETDIGLPQAGFASWSPNGRRVAFSRTIDGVFQLHVIGADGRGERRLVFSSGDDISPCWSADGRRILFVSNRDGNQEVYELDLTRGAVSRLTETAGAESAPNYGPDGAFTCSFSTEPGALGRSSRLFVVQEDGTREPLFTDGVQHYPVWSRDAAQLAFSGKLSAKDGYGIWVMKRNRSPRCISAERIAYNPCWAPDGQGLVFASPVDGVASVFRVDVQPGNELQQLTNNVVPWFEPRISPDGRSILVRVGRGAAHRGIGLLDEKGEFQRMLVTVNP